MCIRDSFNAYSGENIFNVNTSTLMHSHRTRLHKIQCLGKGSQSWHLVPWVASHPLSAKLCTLNWLYRYYQEAFESNQWKKWENVWKVEGDPQDNPPKQVGIAQLITQFHSPRRCSHFQLVPVQIFSCPEQLNRWPQSVSQSLKTLLLDIQRATLETCDLWDIWSEWWEDMTWPKQNWQRQRQRQRQRHFEKTSYEQS